MSTKKKAQTKQSRVIDYDKTKVIEFVSNINVDNGFRNHSQGEHRSTMQLYEWSETYSGIEWEVPAISMGASIGIWHDNKRVTDYDGVFGLPKQAIELLEKNGYNCEYVKDEITKRKSL